MCNVSNRSSSVLCFTKRKKGRILSTTRRTNTLKKMSWRKFVPSVPRNLSTFLREFVRMRVEWCNITPATVMFVTFALKRRNGTRTKHNVQRHLRCHFYIYLQIGIYSDLAMLCYYKVFYFRTLYSKLNCTVKKLTPRTIL